MTELDRKIEEALDAEDRDLMREFGEQGLLEQSFSVFQGKQGWIAGVVTVVSVFLFAGAVYSAWNFFHADEVIAAAQWAAGAWFLMTMVAFIKVWFWMRMESNRVLREIKRLELQFARLQAKKIV